MDMIERGEVAFIRSVCTLALAAGLNTVVV